MTLTHQPIKYDSPQHYTKAHNIPFPNITANRDLLDEFIPLMEAYIIAAYDHSLRNGVENTKTGHIASRIVESLGRLFNRYRGRTDDTYFSDIPVLLIRYYASAAIYLAKTSNRTYYADEILAITDNPVDVAAIKAGRESPLPCASKLVNIHGLTDLFILIVTYIQTPAKEAKFVI